MKKIGICFPEKDFIKTPSEDFKKDLTKLRESGLYSFDLYTKFLLTYKPTNHLLDLFNDLNIKITFHYHGVTYNNNLKRTINLYKKEISELRKILDKNNHKYQTSIVFHVPDYQNDKYSHTKKMIVLFKEISDYAQTYNFNILVETLSHNHPTGQHIGDDFSELKLFSNYIKNDNFGICWDLGHTRLNQIEQKNNLLLTNDLIKRTKHTHIHNFGFKKDQCFDHIPLTNLKMQDDELNLLIDNNYQGIYNLEFEMERLKENIDIYCENIKLLSNYIKERENEKFNN